MSKVDIKEFYRDRVLHKDERASLLKLITQNRLRGITITSKDDFLSHFFGGCYSPISKYYFVCYRENNDIDSSAPWCYIYCYMFDNHRNLIVPLNKECITSKEMEDWADTSARWACSRELKCAIKAVEAQFGVKISQDKCESKSNGVSTSNNILLWKNEKYDGCEVEHVTGVDATSAYTSYLVSHVIDFCTIPGVDYKGQEAAINAAINERLRQYSLEWFNKKECAKTPEEKVKAKRMLNIIIGMIRNSNVWAWKQIVGGVKEYMLSLVQLIEADGCECLYCNTDSIYYVGNTDIFDPLFGKGLGKFHIEHEDCRFRWRKGVMAYQINDDPPVWRGVMGERYELYERINGRPFNLITDDLPSFELLGRIF